MAETYDLITVGGGLGAAALARSLAKKGARVLVIEREEKFKDRVRGEMMAPWGVAEAENLGIAALLRSSCGHDLPWVDFYSGSHLMAHRDPVSTTPQHLMCLSFYHPEMQEVLLGAAAKAGHHRRVQPGSHRHRAGQSHECNALPSSH